MPRKFSSLILNKKFCSSNPMNRSLILPSSYLSTHSDFCRLYYELRLESKLFAGLLLSLILSLVGFFLNGCRLVVVLVPTFQPLPTLIAFKRDQQPDDQLSFEELAFPERAICKVPLQRFSFQLMIFFFSYLKKGNWQT